MGIGDKMAEISKELKEVKSSDIDDRLKRLQNIIKFGKA